MNPPDRLNEQGKKYWNLYYGFLQNPNVVQVEILKDLCYWEQKKEQAIADLEKIGRDFVAYTDENGKVKHTQPVAPMNNLKTAQSKIDKLRESLFDKEALESGIRNEAKLRSVKNF